MPTDIFFISNLALWTFNLLALAISMLYCYREFNPSYLKIFPMYLFVSIAIEILVSSQIDRAFHFRPFGSYQPYLRMVFYNLFTLFELIVFAWFLFQVIRSIKIKVTLIILLSMFIIFFILYSILKGLDNFNDIAVALESIIIIIPCLTYFREIFTWKEPVDLLREPSFWLVTGIFFYLATIFPLYVTRPYLTTNGFMGVTKSLYSINNFALSITYLLFIRSYTCRIKKS